MTLPLQIQSMVLTALLLMGMNACTPTKAEYQKWSPVINAQISTDTIVEEDIHSTDSINSEYAIYQIVIADTGSDYRVLRNFMLNMSSKLNIEVDSMGRYFDVKKNRIVLPEDDEDELYAGEYFPRRFPSETFSIEYLNTFLPAANPNIMAVVAGIFKNAPKTQKRLQAIRVFNKHAFVIVSEMYIGCMH